MMAPVLTDTVTTSGTLALGSEELALGMTKGMLDAPDKRNSMPVGAYRYGASNPRLRPSVPAGA